MWSFWKIFHFSGRWLWTLCLLNRTVDKPTHCHHGGAIRNRVLGWTLTFQIKLVKMRWYDKCILGKILLVSNLNEAQSWWLGQGGWWGGQGKSLQDFFKARIGLVDRLYDKDEAVWNLLTLNQKVPWQFCCLAIFWRMSNLFIKAFSKCM